MSQRKKFVAGNWKMHTTLAEGRELARAIRAEVENVEGVRIAVIPPFTSVAAVAEVLRGSRIEVGGQDLHWEEKGAFTGEVSAPMLRDAGATVVLVGHSERRQYFGETDESANRKVRAALAAGLSPVLCVGETLDERDAGRTLDVVGRQVRGGLAGLSSAELARVCIAYEPVWAIGTGRTATPEQAQEVHAAVRAILRELGGDVTEAIPILYGGSVKPDNAPALLALSDVDGALVGGASLEASSFSAIVRAAA
ncbi:MAG: triose-phosphate isomerase [Pseudomonadota bacterium]|nr:MAG: triose-phosphate isomerase [Pseudomonadota bacterium]